MIASYSYQDLLVWQRGVDLATASYELTKAFPETHAELAASIRRSAISIPALIAKAHGSTRFSQGLREPLGVVAELATYLAIAKTLQPAATFSFDDVETHLDEETKMLNALSNALRSKRR